MKLRFQLTELFCNERINYFLSEAWCNTYIQYLEAHLLFNRFKLNPYAFVLYLNLNKFSVRFHNGIPILPLL
jgi:hypothetical protein